MSQTEQTFSEAQETSPLVYVRTIAAAEIADQISESEIELPEDATLYAIHLEDGTRMAVFSDRHAAFAAARQHGARPVSVH
ncbi:MAG: DUF1150 family protein [Oceanicaulis sp.]